jgi:citrate lyase subunit beta/citryl-CoA lyase
VRSVLLVPADDEKGLARALASEADALIVDLEDSVVPAAKRRARGIATDFLRAVASQASRPRLLVRINAADGGLADDDLDAAMAAAPEGVVLPKSRGGASIQQLGVKLAVREAAFGLGDGTTPIIAIATGNARALFAMDSYRGCSPRLEGLAWGCEDLSADLGAESARGSDGVHAGPIALARNLTLLGAVAADVAPIDAAYPDFRDEVGLRAEAVAARRDGFSAKMAIHPAQVAIINDVFTPSAAAQARARAVVAAFAAAPDAGVVALEGEMLNRSHKLRAERLLRRVNARGA